MKEHSKGFDGLAPYYAGLERAVFGAALQAARLAYLPALLSAERVLILGEGDGRFLARLLKSNPRCLVDSVDSSSAMLARSRRRVGAEAERVRFIAADARTFQPKARDYDAVVTSYFLDMFTSQTLAKCLPRWSEGLRPGGRWAVSDFHLPPDGFGKWRSRVYLTVLYAFFRRVTGIEASQLIPTQALFERSGLALQEERYFKGGLLRAALYRKDGP